MKKAKLQFKIRKVKKKQVKQICKLVIETFNEFVAPSYSSKGREEFLSKITPEKLIKRMRSKKTEYWVAIKDGEIIGIGGLSPKSKHVSLLFVAKKFQKKE